MVFFHVDLSNQIHNKWYRDTVLAAVSENSKYAIRLCAKDKETLKHRFIGKTGDSRVNDVKTIAIVYAYLVYKMVKLINDYEDLTLNLCRDHRPDTTVYKCIQQIFSIMGISQDVRIKFRRKQEGKSKAHKHAKHVYKKRARENYKINNNDIAELSRLIEEINENV
ncbi:MAG: hypothetical protein V1648_03590 [Candidatus Aenigmatarchaeota archaeon]